MIATTSIFWSVVFFILAVSPLVFIHEMGHYLVGRWCGVKADVFSIGFGRAIVSWHDRRGTRWQIGWIPMGGYVRFAGDMSPVSEATDDWLRLPAEERNRTFQSKTVWQRALIVMAGPFTNFLFAVIVLGIFFSVYGEPRVAPEVGAIEPRSAAAAAGLMTGDRITAVDDVPISRFDDIGVIVQVHSGEPLRFAIIRNGAPLDLRVTPRLTEVKDLTGAKSKIGLIGIHPARVDHIRLAPWELPGAAIRFTAQSVERMAVTLGQVATGRRPVDQLGGPVKMAQASNAMAQFGVLEFILFMVMISINLGFINLLPIPTLDGGHLVFYAAEAIRRKPLPLQAQEWAFRGGLALLLAFMVFVTANDIGLWKSLGGLIG